jgi:transcriptional regulator with XRE-family HTH domain
MSAITMRPMNDTRVGTMLRDWRTQRRLSQLDLALDAGISTRHLSFVETGRSKPSAEMVLTLAERLGVPLRDRNRLLLAAGYAPRFAARSLDDPELAPIREALGRVLAGHEPYPAIAVDHGWNLVASNSALAPLLDGVDEALLAPPVNCMRLALHPRGLAPRILNLGEWRAHLLHRLDRAIALTGDAGLRELRAELEDYPGPEWPGVGNSGSGPGDGEIMVELRLRAPDGAGELAFFSTITTFGTAVDITVSELSIEAFFPADSATAAALAARDDKAS